MQNDLSRIVRTIFGRPDTPTVWRMIGFSIVTALVVGFFVGRLAYFHGYYDGVWHMMQAYDDPLTR